MAGKLCKDNNVEPSFLGVQGEKNDFPGNMCISVNEETLHTIPFSKRRIQKGDIVKLDFGITHKGIFTDHCVTVAIGKITKEEKRLINSTRLAVETAISKIKPGIKTGEISYALQTISELSGFNSIIGYAGHGIGYSLWEEPSIPYRGNINEGTTIVQGMVLCVEIQLSMGSGRLTMDPDGWTLRTSDGSKTAMFEDMVLVTEKGYKVLTRM